MSETAEAIEQHVRAHGVNRTELVGSVSRLISVVGLAWDEDVRLLWSAVESHAGHDVALSADQEQAYQRIAGRINRLWSYGHPLDHFLF